MRFIRKVAVATVTVGLSLSLGTLPSTGAIESSEADGVLIIDGRAFTEDDGLEYSFEEYEVGGDAPSQVGTVFADLISPGTISPFAAWGSSYAISTEVAQIRYDGKAKAAANVFEGKRIIQVCFWYSRGGSNVSSMKCSNATSSNRWYAGPEVTHSVYDSLNPWAPKTIFHIQTARIDPTIY